MAYTYQKIQKIRDQIQLELSAFYPGMSIDFLRLVEDRVQTTILAGVFSNDDEKDIKIKKKDHE